MEQNAMSFVKVNTSTVIDFIASAKNRIVFAKPSFLKKEIEAIIDSKKQTDIFVDIYMEAGESAIRYGFGETLALELLNDNVGLFDIHVAKKIRIALLVVDNNALVYMPNLAFIEEESNELSFPNGFLCNEDVTENIIRQFTAKDTVNIKLGNADNVINLPGCHIPLLDSEEVISGIKTSIENLKKKPAIDPANLKKVNFYRNNYKIVKMQVWGVRINKKSINIKPFYSLLPEVNKRLKSSWNILTTDDINELQDTKLFERELNIIIEDLYKKSLFDIGRFGYIIDVKKKEEFIESINNLKVDFKSYLGKEPTKEAKVRFKINDINNKIHKSDLKTILERSRKQLEEHLLKLCPRFEVFKGKIFSEYRNLKMDYDNKLKNEEKIMREFVSLFVSNKLKFTDADEIIEKIDIKLDWYDISDELLFENVDFIKSIESYNLEVRDNTSGYESSK